ncbi:cyclase [Campylobacter lari]|nr:cyclase [Campylobacter lari]EAK9869205.1 cyclase [Campylobacter lari]EAK9882094.1 cyclase [Campylobacter lari]EGK8092957.1 cyclase [Campylobacter lari]EJV0519498.1 cyclase family protein [Campylobacter lari]
MFCDLTYNINSGVLYYKNKRAEIASGVVKISDKFCRETSITIDSHMGTHIDYPAHCIKNGKFGEDYSVDYLFSKKIFLLDINLIETNIPKILQSDFEINIPKDVEILLVKTHFGSIRNSERYIWQSPIVDSKIPAYLKNNYPKLKAIGFDIISVTSQLDREEGKRCHINFLSNQDGKEILIIEDLNLLDLQGNDTLEEIYILPLKFKNMDGSPCSVAVKIKEKK